MVCPSLGDEHSVCVVWNIETVMPSLWSFAFGAVTGAVLVQTGTALYLHSEDWLSAAFATGVFGLVGVFMLKGLSEL